MIDPFCDVESAASTTVQFSLHKSRLGWSLLAVCVLSIGVAYADDSVTAGEQILHPGAGTFVEQHGAERFGNATIGSS